jgi:hypothetical protein
MRILKVPPSRIVGEVLEKLLERVIDDPGLNTKETLAALAAEVAEELKKKGRETGNGKRETGNGK